MAVTNYAVLFCSVFNKKLTITAFQLTVTFVACISLNTIMPELIETLPRTLLETVSESERKVCHRNNDLY